MLYIKKKVPFPLVEVNLRNAKDKELIKISEETGLALSLEEMRRIKNYFVKKGRNPTDVELQSIGQAWSEHCCYKSSKAILKQFIFNIKNKDMLAKGDAGVMAFDDKYAYALRIESHNHPSAIEPYGGAATGIGGILRDVLCMGAQPIALVDPLYFGPLDYSYDKLAKGVKHPKYLFGGVVAGIRDYGNRVGIPTVSGAVCFDEGYVGNCIVNVGCVGITKKSNVLRNAVKKVGDLLVLVGGKTGRDGIHGVTFASAVLTKKSDEEYRGAVQLGDPIMKEPLIHACLEANEKKLLNGMKDLGGGGLSCVVGEMSLAGGCGAEVELDKVPLKEVEMAPWEIWVSESQERMMLAVDPKNIEEVLHIFKFYDVPATIIGKVIKEKVVRLYFKGTKVFDMELEFLTRGPVYCRPYRIDKSAKKLEEIKPKELENYNEILLRLLSDLNIASKDWVIRQYDHEVRGSTTIKPLQGKVGFAAHGDASVIKPLEDSNRGLAICVATNPWVCAINPYKGGKSIIDEMCRNLSSVGAIPHSLTNCLNFGAPEKPDRLGAFYECVRGIGEVALKLNIAIPSGNVSFYNETELGAVPPTPTVLGVGIVKDARKCVTTDLKCTGNPVYLVGEPKNEMGGSHYYRVCGGYSSIVPDVNVNKLREALNFIISSIEKGFVASCHDISDGGLGVNLAEMCLGGNLGAEIDFSPMENLKPDVILFSESNTRWLLEIKKDCENAFLRLTNGIPIYKIGRVWGRNLIVKSGKRELINLSIADIRKKWYEPLWDLMG